MGAGPGPRALLTLRAWTLWLAALAMVLLLRLLWRQRFVDGDTVDLVRSAEGLLACLAQGRRGDCVEAGQWPLLQFGPAMLVLLKGGSHQEAGLLLASLSLVAFAGLLALPWWTLAGRSQSVALLAVLVLASGLPLHYATRSFGESLASLLTAALAALWLRRGSPALLALLAFFVGLSKETALPYLVLLGAACTLAHAAPGRGGWRQALREEQGRLLGAAAGVGVSVLLSAAFNIYRFGTPLNLSYLRAAGWGPPPEVQMHLLPALWVAPNAGLLFFWPLLVLLLVALPLAVWRQGRHGAARPTWLPMLAVATLLGGLCMLLVRWWAPFGWWAWGSRLMLPWLPAALLILLFAYAKAAQALLRPLVATSARVALLAIAVCAAGAPHWVSIVGSNALLHPFFVEQGICGGADRPESRPAYYRCLLAQAWEHPSPLLHAYRLLPDAHLRLRGLAYPAVLVLACVELRRRVREERAGTAEG